MSKVMLIVSDALRDDMAAAQMGYLQGLIEQKQGARYTCLAELPTLSRPLYATIQNGVSPIRHGITSNRMAQRSNTASVFSQARDANKTTAAAAYSWYSELFVRAPYDLIADREQDDESQLIQHGRYYSEDSYPDIELFADAALLMTRYQPDYLVIHPMGLDYIGELHGAHSGQYERQLILQDQILANLLPTALGAGYSVVVTGDHGIDDKGCHNGTTSDVRRVPLYIFDPRFAHGDADRIVSQLQIAPTLCDLLGIPVASTMQAKSLFTESRTSTANGTNNSNVR